MARDPDTIEREIEKARDALASTLDQLGTRAHPRKLADHAKSSIGARLAEPKVKYSLIGVAVVIGLLLLRKLLR